jgi:hypothetical protein
MEGRDKVWHGYNITDSSNVEAIMWLENGMVVKFKSGSAYFYEGVSRQKAVACARASSVGRYINQKIKPHHKVVSLP